MGDVQPPMGNVSGTTRNAADSVEQLTTLKVRLGSVLRTGAWCSVALVTAGLVVVLIRGEEHAALKGTQSAGHVLFHDPGVTVVSLGMIVLVATPILRELTAATVFARHGDRTYLTLTAVVLFLVVVALAVGAR